MSGFLSRRTFVAGAFGLPVLPCAVRADAAVRTADAVPLLKLGVISDIHLFARGMVGNLRKAFAAFREAGVDAVAITGDISTNASAVQFAWCMEAWKAVFGDDGRVGRLFISGNHDIGPWCWDVPAEKRADPSCRVSHVDARNVAEQWERIFGEKYEHVWMRSVRGVPFVGVQWDAQPAEVDAFFAEHGEELHKAEMFFYLQHAHPKDTCLGSWAWGHDDGASTRRLSRFPNAVALSGHSHYTLTDERSVWQGQFTSVNAGSYAYSSVEYSLRENAKVNGGGYCGEKRAHAMKVVGSVAGQGMILTVCKGLIRVERRDFLRGLSLGEDWMLSIPPDGSMSFESRRERRHAPEFAGGSKVAVALEAENVVVSFPSAQPVRGCRPFEYEVSAILVADDVDLVQVQRRVLANDFNLPESMATRDERCLFRIGELPLMGQYRFSVRPIECFGRKGRPIWNETPVRIG